MVQIGQTGTYRMSNKDSNGYERPWILETEIYNPCINIVGSRSRIVPNTSYSFEGMENIGKEELLAWALSMAIRDATMHLVSKAQISVMKHIADAGKW